MNIKIIILSVLLILSNAYALFNFNAFKKRIANSMMDMVASFTPCKLRLYIEYDSPVNERIVDFSRYKDEGIVDIIEKTNTHSMFGGSGLIIYDRAVVFRLNGEWLWKSVVEEDYGKM